MIDAWLEPDEDFFEYQSKISEEINEDNEPNGIDFDEYLERALRAIERTSMRKNGLLYG